MDQIMDETMVRIGRFAKREVPGRGDRPGVMEIPSNDDPPENCAFRCVDASHAKSIYREGPRQLLNGGRFKWAFVRNQFPAFEVHNIVVPCVETAAGLEFPHEPQTLTLEFIEDLVGLADQHSRPIFFNGLTAGATVPHFHFQQIGPDWIPVDHIGTTQLKAGLTILESWPCAALVFQLNEAESLWRTIENLSGAGVSFNLLASNRRLILVPRSKLGRGDFDEDFGSGMPASSELCGGIFIFTDATKFAHADEAAVSRVISRAGLEPAALAEIL
ncbi:MAG: diadenosine tetraphosphate (Ap4A) HIT family hydrolase [Verrucomicrobiales bacterium]|jgi:diadenosine tetraphosphate (Ap4A) HIT family hydrolase